jgi:predicted nucleic acid-binding protein
MASLSTRFVVDCSVVVKWKLTAEPHAAEAEEVFLDWQHAAVELCAPNFMRAEVMSTFLRAHRRGRISEADAADFTRDLLSLPFVVHDLTAPIALKALEIAQRHNQGSFDCVYVALAEQEGIEFWTGDKKLYNALGGHFSFIRWLGNYQRKRP